MERGQSLGFLLTGEKSGDINQKNKPTSWFNFKDKNKMKAKSISDVSGLSSAEERILEAAAVEFASNGFFGARTQAIADSANVNKAMLHYYFRTKENLYGRVIRAAFYRVLARVGQAWSEKGPIEERVEKVVDSYMDHYEKNPEFLRIILREVVDGGERFRRIFKEIQNNEPEPDPLSAIEVIDRVAEELNLTRTEVVHFVVNLVGMCAFSFISPLLLETLIHFHVPDFQAYLGDRRTAIKAMALSHVKAVIAGSKRSQQ
jgi:TetR/AcrR family transcriptional regulator